jgi:hypothetical protein
MLDTTMMNKVALECQREAFGYAERRGSGPALPETEAHGGYQDA